MAGGDSSSALDLTYAKQVRPWLELAEDLRVLSLDSTLAVPQICVMGDESSGKSSALEALSGVPFPRGSGLVTRCPSSPHTITADSPEELTSIISRLTDSVTRNSNGFSREAIVVRLTSDEAPDLMVVDLPGIVRTTTAGQQAMVIDEINAMLGECLSQERMIILAVIPAKQDIATVDILERALRVDAEGERKLGVLTKPDLVGPGNEEEVVAVLTNVRKPLKLGYVMGITYDEASADEARFFASHGVFSRIDSRLLGTERLTASLTTLLVACIQEELAPMKRQVEMMLARVRTELRDIASFGMAATPGDRQKLFVALAQEFIRHLNDCVRGEYRDRIIVVNTSLRLYTRALVIFQELQSKIVSSAPPRFRDEHFVENLALRMEALRGRKLPGFMSAQSFYMFIQEFIDAWGPPAKMAAAQTRALANEVVRDLIGKIAAAYPALREAFEHTGASILEQTEDEAVKLVEGLITRGKDPFTINDFIQVHINKLRYDRFEAAVETAFVGVGQGGASQPGVQGGSWEATKQHVAMSIRNWYRDIHGVSSAANAEDVSAIIEAYWKLASKRFVDNACMAMPAWSSTTESSGPSAGKLQEALYRLVHDDEKLAAFFSEDATIVAKRANLGTTRDKLTKANTSVANIQGSRKPLPSKAKSSSSKNQNSPCVYVKIQAGAQGLGLQLADENDKVLTRGFRAGSLAQQSGVMLGDVLTEINGEPSAPSTTAITRTLLRDPQATNGAP
ncbi:hypothetical protein CTAYLR_009067 [Chrysophaeum taylorii]|uniref:Uncharacterized protein n=1 Tax=Chrysophaeum taylorii TaxID=2483200 RepID=A0AAD7XLU6_9STRA|nr:hypothetical protein CTAYLR_009067 [Chrysophaeum taylorii]